MPQPRSSSQKHCTPKAASQRASIKLPVLAAGQGGHAADGQQPPANTIRKSKNAKRRAIVLTLVQLLIIVHVLLWYFGAFGGKTLTPIEPSEAMEFSKYGVVNAGLIFFALALLSTLILGRWFCGWGCHVVLLQDFCGWMMKKCGIRPKPFRSRFLVYVPLLLALYMFVWPAAYRWVVAPASQQLSTKWEFIPNTGPVPHWPGLSTQFTTPDFWKTFPGWAVAIPFLFICGFAAVYFLGAKGFCTYGCPYGGFFAPLDKLSPGRIIVTDACEQCGHCTAVCTSNVRVHEEVREYGMVVDPGCMKCLDCVSVCPNDALYFGFTKPAALKGKPKNEAPRRVYDLTMGEEFAMAIVFAGAFFAFRGDLIRFPLLMTAGVAGVITFLMWKLWRLLRDKNVNLYRFQLKLKGSMRLAGWIYAACVVVIALLTLNTGTVNAAMAMAQWHNAKVAIRPEVTFSPNPPPIDRTMARHAELAIALYRLASHIGEGGIGIFRPRQVDLDLSIAKLQCEQREFAAAEHTLRRALDRTGPLDALSASLMWVLEAQGRRAEALAYGESLIRERPGFPDTIDSFQQLAMRDRNLPLVERVLRHVLQRDGVDDITATRLVWVLQHQGRVGEAIDFARQQLLSQEKLHAMIDAFVGLAASVGDAQLAVDGLSQRLQKFGDHLHTMRRLAVCLQQVGQLEQSVALTRRIIEIEPTSPAAHQHLAMLLADLERFDEAIASMRQALKLAPRDPVLHELMAWILQRHGLPEEARRHRELAAELQSQLSQH